MQRFEQIYEEHREAVRAYVRRCTRGGRRRDRRGRVWLRRIEDIPDLALPWRGLRKLGLVV